MKKSHSKFQNDNHTKLDDKSGFCKMKAAELLQGKLPDKIVGGNSNIIIIDKDAT